MRSWSEMLRFTNDFGFKFLKFASRYYPPENHCCFNHFIQDLLVINFGRTRENLRKRWNLLWNFENKVEIDMILMVLTLSKKKNQFFATCEAWISRWYSRRRPVWLAMAVHRRQESGFCVARTTNSAICWVMTSISWRRLWLAGVCSIFWTSEPSSKI